MICDPGEGKALLISLSSSKCRSFDSTEERFAQDDSLLMLGESQSPSLSMAFLEPDLDVSWKSVLFRAVFLAACGKENRGDEDGDDQRHDKEGGREIHGAGSLGE